MSTENMFGLEMIAFQKDNIFGDIVDEVVKYRAGNNGSQEDTIRIIGNILTKRFGMPLKTEIWDKSFANADILIEDFVKRNPLYDDMNNRFLSDSDIVGKGTVITAHIDKKKAKLSGSITKYPPRLRVTSGSLGGVNDKNYTLTPEEVGTMVLHEIGHVFTIIEYLTEMTRSSIVIRSRTQDLIGRTVEDRIKIIDSDKALQGIPKADRDDLINCQTETGLQVTLLRYEMRKFDDQLGMKYYSQRYLEQAADMFAIRCGCGRNLASFIYKIESHLITKDDDYLGYIIDGVIMTAFLGLPIIILALMTAFIDTGAIYDDPIERALFNKRALVSKLKETTDPKDKARLIRDIRYIDEMLGGMKKMGKTLLNYTTYLLVPSHRRNTKQVESMKQIEELIDNDLYTSSAELNQILK